MAYPVKIGAQHPTVAIDEFEICLGCREAMLLFMRTRRAEAAPAPHVVVFQKELPR